MFLILLDIQQELKRLKDQYGTITQLFLSTSVKSASIESDLKKLRNQHMTDIKEANDNYMFLSAQIQNISSFRNITGKKTSCGLFFFTQFMSQPIRINPLLTDSLR